MVAADMPYEASGEGAGWPVARGRAPWPRCAVWERTWLAVEPMAGEDHKRSDHLHARDIDQHADACRIPRSSLLGRGSLAVAVAENCARERRKM